MENNPALKKAFSVLLGVFTFLLIGFGFSVLGYLGFQVYKGGGLSTKNISQNLSVPSPSSEISLSANTKEASSSTTTSPLRIIFTGDLKTDMGLVFSGPQYSDLISLINKSQDEADSGTQYQDYKQAFSTISAAYTQTKDPDMLLALLEVRSKARTLNEFQGSDMPIPQ